MIEIVPRVFVDPTQPIISETKEGMYLHYAEKHEDHFQLCKCKIPADADISKPLVLFDVLGQLSMQIETKTIFAGINAEKMKRAQAKN